jgi:hypothetical protein
VPPPAEREAEGGGEERDQQHVRARHAGVVEERGGRRDERRATRPLYGPRSSAPKSPVHATSAAPASADGQPDHRFREARGAARDRREPVVEDRLVRQQLVVEARPEPVPGDHVLHDPRLARLVVADDVGGAEPVQREREPRGRDEEREPLSA